MQELQRKLVNKQLELDAAMEMLSEKHVDVKKLKVEIHQLEKRLKSELQSIVSSEQLGPNYIYQRLREKLTNLKIQQDTFRIKTGDLQQRLEVNRMELKKFLEYESELLRLEEECSILREIHRDLRMRFEQYKTKKIDVTLEDG